MEQLTAAQQAAELNKKNLFATYNHIEAEFVEPDHAIFKLEIRPESKNPYGIVHGGAIYTMADNATGYAAHTDGRSYVTQGSSMHFLRNQSEGVVRAECGHFRRGRQTPRHGRVHLFLHRPRYHGTEGRAAPLRRV